MLTPTVTGTCSDSSIKVKKGTEGVVLILKDLEDVIQEKLGAMLAVNPNRVDYYKRYMDIIEAYNSEQDRTTIEKTFMELMQLAQSMTEEEQRYVREGFSNDEELSIYDLLFSENLSKADIKKIKELSVDLLQKLKNVSPRWITGRTRMKRGLPSRT